MTALHSDWAPSSMARILSCPASVEFTKLYPKEDSDASSLGTVAHGVLENAVVFGQYPNHADMAINEGVELAVEWLAGIEAEYGKKHTKVYVEHKLTIPETPIWGTADFVIVTPKVLHIADYKHGFLPVETRMNAQLLTYLVAAIAEFGERSTYEITVIQPRYNHIDGPTRPYTVTESDLDWFKGELYAAIRNPNVFGPSKHCKYCPAAGSCKSFAAWIAPKVGEALYYDMTNENIIKNETLAELLDMSDLVQGWVKALRAEAFRRVLRDQPIPSYKIVMGNKRREFKEGVEEELKKLYDEWGIPVEALYESSFVGPAVVEDHVKSTFRGRNKWKEPFKKVESLIVDKRNQPSLVRDIDGRQMFRKGMEFTDLTIPEKGDIEL